ncbi:MAG: hypothetical protein Q4G13_05365 [Moraxella sp.]|nr:hypothetical protein [Moraxella sp.]
MRNQFLGKRVDNTKSKSLLSWGLYLAIAMAAVLLLWYLATLLWLVVAPPTPFVAQAIKVDKPINAEIYRLFDTQELQVATTLAGVKVIGVMPAIPNAKSRAILDVSGRTVAVGVGDVVADTHTLMAVGLDEVILASQAGDKVILKLHEPVLGRDVLKSNASGVIDNSSLLRYSQDRAAADNTAQVSNQASYVNGANNGAGSSPNNPLMRTDQTMSVQALSQMGFEQAAGGYQITSNLPADLREKMGLQAGDKVISINGKTLGQDVATDMMTMQSLEGEAVVQIERGNEVITIRQNAD